MNKSLRHRCPFGQDSAFRFGDHAPLHALRVGDGRCAVDQEHAHRKEVQALAALAGDLTRFRGRPGANRNIGNRRKLVEGKRRHTFVLSVLLDKPWLYPIGGITQIAPGERRVIGTQDIKVGIP